MVSKKLHRYATGLVITLVMSVLLVGVSNSPTFAASATHLGKISAASTNTTTFTNFELGAAPGTVCPGGGTACTNTAGEPQIRADQNGNFYASSENGLGAGTLAWRSGDGGLHYTGVTSPDGVSSSNYPAVAPGGGDTDVAVAPVKNANGNYNVYVASLSLANIDVSTSTDGGYTWSLNPTSATIPGDDREWIAADGTSKVCISYHDVTTDNIDVNCSADAGTTFTQLGDAIDTAHAYLIDNNEIGNLTIDHNTHNIYQIFSGIGSATDEVCSQQGTCSYHAVWVGVSTDGGQTFTDYPVYINPDATVAYEHQFVNMTIDSAGNLYAVYSDNHNIYYSYSVNHGQTWSAPVQINKNPSNTAIEPWSVAGDNGKLDIVWYGTSYYDGVTIPDNYPATASWNVYFAQNLNATTPGSTFTQVAASPVNHYGGVCESGVSCTGNRDLYDDFGIAASPTTGLASIIYTDDQYEASAASSTCTPTATNTSSCTHTSIATQTGGSVIYASTTTTKK